VIVQEAPDKSHVGGFIARRLKRVTTTSPWSRLLVTAAMDGDFHDPQVRQDLADALLAHARLVRPLVDPEVPMGDPQAPTLWCCLRRAMTLLTVNDMTRMLEFLTKENPQVSSLSVFQCLFDVFSIEYPPEGPMLETLRAAVDPLIEWFLSDAYLGDWNGARVAVAGNAYLAGLVLRVPNLDRYTQRMMEGRHDWPDGSFSWLGHMVLYHTGGILELARPDTTPYVDQLLACARKKGKSTRQASRKDAIERAQHFRPELLEGRCTTCQWNLAEINDGDDAMGPPVCCDCYNFGVP